jgi:ankyrin repeat protein
VKTREGVYREYYGYIDAMGLLLENGADVNAMDADSKTPLLFDQIQGWHAECNITSE